MNDVNSDVWNSERIALQLYSFQDQIIFINN